MDDDLFLSNDPDPAVLSLVKRYFYQSPENSENNEDNGDYATYGYLYKAFILGSIRDGTANRSISDGILDSLILIEKLDRRQGISPSDSMRDAFRAVAVHCTLRCLPFSWSSYFDAVQRIWKLRIKNLEDSGASDLLSPDLVQWRTEIEAALWDTETSQRLLHIGTLGEALNCIGAYLSEAFRSMKPASRRLAVVPTAGLTVDHVASASVPTDENVDNVASASAQLPSNPHPCTNEGKVFNVVSAQLLPSPHCCTDKENNSVAAASAHVPLSPHRCTNDEKVDNVVSASAQLQLVPYCCTDEENRNMRENSHSSPRRNEGPVITADVEEDRSSSSNCGTLSTSEVNKLLQIVLKIRTPGLQAGPTDSLNEALEVSETVAPDMARESLHMEDPNKDMGDPTTSHCPTTHNCNDNGKRTMRVNSQIYKLRSSRRRHKRPLIISDLEEAERVASDMGSENLHAEDSNKDRGDPTNYCTEKGKRIPMLNSQTRCDPRSSHRHYEGPAGYGSISTPEIEKVRDSLKSSVAELLATVTDPLPRVLDVADRIASYVAAAKNLHTQGVEGDGNKEGDVHDEACRKDHERMDGSVPAPSVDHTAEPSQAKEGNEAFIRPKKVCRTGLMERNDTARTFEWEDSIDGSAEGTSGSSNRCTLPSPKTMHASPLKKSEPLKWGRRRKINRWTDEEEKALMEGVRKYGTQWKLILSVYEEILSNRTQVDLKDKWRNLSRK